jgi:transcription elongation factor Elf1
LALKFNCPKCNCELVVKFLKSGETAKCYDCGSFITVPDDAEPNDSESSVLKSAKTRPYIEPQTDSYTVIPRFGDALSYSWQVISYQKEL